MDKPSKVEVGQRWRSGRLSVSNNEVLVTDVSEAGTVTYEYTTGTLGKGWTRSMVQFMNFIGDYIGTGATPTGNRAADWLRNVAKVLEEKAISYGDSVGNPIRVFSHAGKTEGIKVRIDDKLSRVARGKEWPGDDVIVDLVGYLALLAVTEEDK